MKAQECVWVGTSWQCILHRRAGKLVQSCQATQQFAPFVLVHAQYLRDAANT